MRAVVVFAVKPYGKLQWVEKKIVRFQSKMHTNGCIEKKTKDEPAI